MTTSGGIPTCALICASGHAPTGFYADSAGKIRLQRPLRSWEDYVDLAFNDISHYGADHRLVQRELVEAFDRLLENVPESYKLPVEYQCEMLTG